MRRLAGVHALVAAVAAVELVRALHQPWLRDAVADEALVFGWAIVLVGLSTVASAAAIAVGLGRRHVGRALVADAVSIGIVLALVFFLAQASHLPAADALGLLLVAIVVRLAAPLAGLDPAVPLPAVGTRTTTAFLAANAVLVVLLALWPIPPECGIGCNMRARWLPFGLVLATGVTLALARSGDAASLYRRHAWLWLSVPLAFALQGWRHDPLSAVGVPIVGVTAGIALQAIFALVPTARARGDRATGRLLGFAVVTAALALLPYVRTVQPTESDEPHYLVVMESLAYDHSFDVKKAYDRVDYLDFYPHELEARHIIDVGAGEKPIHDVGLPILGAIPFALGRRTGVLAFMCVVVGLFAWRGYALLRRLEFTPEASVWTVGIVALLHPLFTYTTQVSPDPIGALVVLVAAKQLAGRITAGALARASALLGILPWLSARHWLIAVGMGLVVAWLAIAPAFRGRWRDSLRLVPAGALPFAALVLAFCSLDLALFGVFVPNAGYYLIRDQYYVVAYTPWIGGPGLLLDRTFGLLSHTPLYLLAFVGLVPLLRVWRRLRSPAIVALLLGWVFYFVYISDVYYWWADGAPSSRYQLASVAFLMIAIAAGIERLRGPLAVGLAVVAAAWSAAVTLLYAIAPNIRYDIVDDVRAEGGPGFLWVSVTRVLRADPGLLFPSMVRAAPQDFALAALWGLVAVALVFLGARAARPPRPASAHTA